MKIDLHGLNSEEAVSEILAALLSLDIDKYEEELEIITGKGLGFIMTTAINLLDEENRKYKLLKNKIIVYKNCNEFNDDLEIEFEKIMEEIKK